MSREIKFRAWDEENEIMLYSDKDYEECTFVCESDGKLKCFVPEVVPSSNEEPEHVIGRELEHIMEFTGLKDKNGRGDEIYAKDLVMTDAAGPYVVLWRKLKGQWWLRGYRKIDGMMTQWACPLMEAAGDNFIEKCGTIHDKQQS